MRIKWGSVAFTGLLMIFALVIFLSSLSFAPKPRMFPVATAIAALIMILLLLINEIHPIRFVTKLEIDLMGVEEARPQESVQERSMAKMLDIVAWMIGFAILVFLVGFYISIAVFSLAFFRFRAEAGWLKTVLISAVLWSFIFVIFGVVLELHMFKGVFFGEMIPEY